MHYDPKLASGSSGQSGGATRTALKGADSGPASAMVGVNAYWVQLPEEEIASGGHRAFVGGMWEEIGRLQFEKLREEGLRPEHRLLDVGCGALRGGLHFARYLLPGNYHGIDINPSLLDAGRRELAAAGLQDRDVRLHLTDSFDATPFGVAFDYAISVSLLTHLNANLILQCFCSVRRVMHAGSRFFFTFFEAPTVAHIAPVEQVPGAFTHYTRDCFHYARVEVEAFAGLAGLHLIYHGAWNHPRGQKLVELRLPGGDVR